MNKRDDIGSYMIGVMAGVTTLAVIIVTAVIVANLLRDWEVFPSAIFTDMGEARRWHRDCLNRNGSVRVREYEYGLELTCLGGGDDE